MFCLCVGHVTKNEVSQDCVSVEIEVIDCCL